ncbi:hypothetical protein AYO20_09625 [Fonsecaea nubica]|uniref:Alkaline ceramidase 3 n=1 Tax=Fonsecaea nubica TaxID=856822 RepID=A0A178CG50_9EURO|nr:hypothetical protein AYO20_09625 [Fonsecaea nubica]OAL28003.1 hypothetical protein AYO20_09625 [Fonsecaea nubica]
MGIERNFAGDHKAHLGYWGPPTSVANFCEEDYAVTLYVGEFVNSFTNLAYVVFTVYWAFRTLLPGESLLTRPSNLALFFVGVFSLVFHLTLKYETQVCDDLSMFWVCAALVYELYTLGWSKPAKLSFAFILTAVLGVISAYHYALHQLWLHNVTFIALVTAIWPRVLYLIRTRFKGEKKQYWTKQFRVGGLCFLMGFVVWAIDGAYCGALRETRKQLGIPLAFVLELHGWWHILTALGAGYCIRVTKVLIQDHASE